MLLRQPEQLTGNICVFAAAREAGRRFTEAAQRTGELIGLHQLDLVYGGIDLGLMRHVADAARSNGSRVTGVLPIPVAERSVYLPTTADLEPKGEQIIHTGSLIERKFTMLNRSDAVIALAGGIGTFDEIVTTLELSRGQESHGAESRLVILNTAGYYDGLKQQLERTQRERFMGASVADYAFFADTPEAAMIYIQNRLGAAYAKLGRVAQVEL